MSDECPPFPSFLEGQIGAECPIINKKGLHARASAKFVQCVEQFDAEILVTRCDETVNGLEIMDLMMLSAAFGTTIQITASGAQKEDALKALTELVANRFGEEE